MQQVRIPLELEHLIRSAVADTQRKDPGACVKANPTNPPNPPNPPNQAKPTTLAECMAIIDSRKAMEVEHYLRACALRLDIVDGLTGLNGLNGM